MEICVDGGCRRNGSPDAIGAAAAVFKLRSGKHEYYTRQLPRNSYEPVATNQPAEITAIMLALEMALHRYHDLNSAPFLEVKVYSDSKYAVGCMNTWIYRWAENGWINSQGNKVANVDLIQEATYLDDKVDEKGRVEYIWIPRCDNEDADRYCNEELDKMEEDSEYSSSDDNMSDMSY